MVPRSQELLICANFDVSPSLHDKLLQLVRYLEQVLLALRECTDRGAQFSYRLLNRLNTHTYFFDSSAGGCWCSVCSQVLVAQAHPNDWTDGVKKLGVDFRRALGGEQKMTHRIETLLNTLEIFGMDLHPDLFEDGRGCQSSSGVPQPLQRACFHYERS